ncbi:MAG: sigma-54-dependent Fis family transcriptional regulator [Acidobacteria bacterium]|nr:sigma-54-dependent Fis family transcriptional regulator [Acidobacteriota bacterium]
MNARQVKILAIGGEVGMLEFYRRTLPAPKYQTVTEASAEKALKKLQEEAFDLILIDLCLPEMDGIQLLDRAKESDPDIEGAIITGYPTVDTAVKAVKHGAFDYLAKPLPPDQLRAVVDKAIAQRELCEENRALRKQVQRSYEVSEIIGRSKAIQEVLDLVQKIGPTETNVLLLGESGSGKELIARCIHGHSFRREYPMVPIDCAALPETLAEAELFGHEK